MTSELRQAAENLRLQIRGRMAELEAQRGQLQAQMAALGNGPARPALSPVARQIIQEMSGDAANGTAMPVNGNGQKPAGGPAASTETGPPVTNGAVRDETSATTIAGSAAQTILSPAADRASSEPEPAGAAKDRNEQPVAGDTAVLTAREEEAAKDGGPVAMATGPAAMQKLPGETAASVLDEQEADEDDWLARIAAAQADRQEQADAAAVDGPDEQGTGEDDWLASMEGEPAAATEADDWLAAFG